MLHIRMLYIRMLYIRNVVRILTNGGVHCESFSYVEKNCPGNDRAETVCRAVRLARSGSITPQRIFGFGYDFYTVFIVQFLFKTKNKKKYLNL